jgi:hypothetical protein
MRMRPQMGIITALAVGALAVASMPAHALNPPYDPLTLTCLGTNGTNFVEIGVKAGDTGAPAGFTLQWMTLSDWEANGGAWFDSDDPRLCKMSFSGQPSFSGAHATLRWELSANDEVVVRIGDQLFDETGVSGALADDGTGNFTQPGCELQCGRDYVFRAFAHASRFNSRSAFSFISGDGSPNLDEPGEICSTSSDCGGCTFTQGYWKTHGPVGCVTGNNTDTWQESTWPVGLPTVSTGCPAGAQPILTLGTVNYCAGQICSILKAPAKGNGLIALAHQLIAAKLNALVNGATCDAADIAAADAAIGGKVLPPVGSGTAKPGDVSSLTGALDNFNNGLGCAAHCTVQRNGAKPVQLRWGQVKVRYR